MTGKEIRIAMVISGGVSLATYMHGSTREFYDFNQSSCDKSENCEVCNEFEVCENYYRKLKNKYLKVDNVVIDVISGTSAGGINGVLLATALARNSNLDDSVSKLWTGDSTQIKKLLELEKNDKSILSSNKLKNNIREAVKKFEIKGAKDNNENSYLDLYVTSANVRGYNWKKENIQGKNYLNRFHLKLRETSNYNQKLKYHHNDFEKIDDIKNIDDILVRICSSTSAIPGIFRPEEFKFKELKKITFKDNIEEFYSNFNDEETIYLHDGGLIDNKPFEPIIDSIGRISSNKLVDRWVVFIDPTNGLNNEIALGELSIMESIKKGYTGFGFQSIYDDLLKIDNKKCDIEKCNSIINSYYSIIDNYYEGCKNKAHKKFYNSNLINEYFKNFYKQVNKNKSLKIELNDLMSMFRDYNINDFSEKDKKIIYIDDMVNFFMFQILRINNFLDEKSEKKDKFYEYLKENYLDYFKRLINIKEVLWNMIEFIKFISWMIYYMNDLSEIDNINKVMDEDNLYNKSSN